MSEFIRRRVNPRANWHGRHTSYPYNQPDVCTCSPGVSGDNIALCANADCRREAKGCGGWCSDCFAKVMPSAVTKTLGGTVEFVRPATHKVWRPPQYVYVASSWRNELQPAVVAMIAGMGIGVYDFKNPPGGTGFSWRQVKPVERTEHEFVPYRANPTICSICGSVRPMPCLRLPVEPVTAVAAKGTDWEPAATYLEMVNHPVARKGFQSDFDAMLRADTFVMVLPCGKSAHLELGWATGAGKQTVVLLEDPVEPELMYHCADNMVTDLAGLQAWLRGPEGDTP